MKENGVERERGVRKRRKGSRDKDESTKSHHGKVIYRATDKTLWK